MHVILCALALLLSFAAPAWAQPTPVTANWELAALPTGQPGDKPAGQSLVAVLWLTPSPGYKAYANDPGEAGMPTRAQVRLTPTGQNLPVLYPPGKAGQDLYEKDKAVNIYDVPTPLFVLLPENTPPGFGLEAVVSLLACTETSCWPMQLETSFSSREVPAPALAQVQGWWPLFSGLAAKVPGVPAPVREVIARDVQAAKASASAWKFTPRSVQPHLEVDSLLKALPLAILAGFLLNLMPCVLPVACLKLSSLLTACDQEQLFDRHRRIREHNVYFALGILGYFCVLAVVLGLAGLAWGQMFQQPGLVFGAAAVLFSMGMSLFGVFHLPVIDLKIATRPGHSPRAQALGTGFLATLLATPCSGPFLGGVLAWTLLQPVPVVMAVFVGIGLGMALPYLVLAARPELTRFVPRPGAWMSQLEKMAGFLIMATCLYFLTMLPQPLLVPALAALLVVALACHAWGSWSNLSQGAFTRWAIRLGAVSLAVAACIWAMAPPAPRSDVWKPFDKAAFTQALGEKKLFLDFTADWCPTCKALEKTVLAPEAVAALQKRYGFTAMRVDLTREDPETMALLRALGSASIPVAAMFPKGEESLKPVVLRDLFTASQLEDAMKEAFADAK